MVVWKPQSLTHATSQLGSDMGMYAQNIERLQSAFAAHALRAVLHCAWQDGGVVKVFVQEAPFTQGAGLASQPRRCSQFVPWYPGLQTQV